MTKKTVIKPILGSEKTFKISHKRYESGISEKNKSGKTYSFLDDLVTTKLNYQNIINSLPTHPGIIILTGHYQNHQITLEIIKSNESIRHSFSKPLNKNRYQTLIDYLTYQKFDHLEIQLAQAS